MRTGPEISVVMSVYDGAASLPATLDSILGQQGCNFEFIVVDDGSTDGAGDILVEYAGKDSRLRLIRQENQGLTRALRHGCALARGEFIARQDAGDVSLPGRLATQLAFMRRHAEAVMCGCAVQFVGPQQESLFVTARPMMQLDDGLRQADIHNLKGPPHHGGTLFRREIYEQVGGYRMPFIVAQDIDLWLRLAERGTCLGVEDILYQAHMEMGSISSRRRKEQIRLSVLALACAEQRRLGAAERKLLESYVPMPSRKGPMTRLERARFHYFIASCLHRRDYAAARAYYMKSLRDNPFHLKALLKGVIY